MAVDVVLAGAQPLAEGWIAFQRQRAGVEGDVHLELVEQPAQAPNADPAAELEVHLRPQIAGLGPELEAVLPPAVVDAVVRDRVLGPLLVVDDQVQSEQGAAGPVDRGRDRSVADKIARRSAQYAIHPPSTSRLIPLI